MPQARATIFTPKLSQFSFGSSPRHGYSGSTSLGATYHSGFFNSRSISINGPVHNIE